MAFAQLNIEDGPEGTVRIALRTEGAFNRQSPAHCAALTLLTQFEQHAERLDDPQVTVDPISEIGNHLDRETILFQR